MKLLFALSVVAVFGGLVAAVTVYRRRRVAEVYRNEGETILVIAKGLVVGGLVLAFLVFMIANNR